MVALNHKTTLSPLGLTKTEMIGSSLFHRVGFLRRFGLKKGVYTLPILVWNRVWFSRELRRVRTYLSFQLQMSKQEREICEFEMDLNNFLFAL